jgi:hypothetical protein
MFPAEDDSADQAEDDEEIAADKEQVFTWENPVEVIEAEKDRYAWAVIRRRSIMYREDTDFEQYCDSQTKLMFWFFWKSGDTHTE